jgi:hypothetical protein
MESAQAQVKKLISSQDHPLQATPVNVAKKKIRLSSTKKRKRTPSSGKRAKRQRTVKIKSQSRTKVQRLKGPEIKLNKEFKIVLPAECRRFYAWTEEDPTVIATLKKTGWEHLGDIVKDGREDYPTSMYDAKKDGEIDLGYALIWADDDDSKVLQEVSDYHLISSIPRAARSLTKSYQQKMFGTYNWFPKCFTIPEETDLLNKELQENPNSYWICKPDDGYGGNRMCVYKAGSEEFNNTILKRKTTLVVQRYMSNPYLFANMYKFHFRCYMVISNCDPLRAYLWKNAQIQFATHKFDLEQVENKFNKYCHITNYKVNNEQKNTEYALKDKNGIGKGTEWSIESFASYMAKECPEFKPEKFWSDLTEIAKVVSHKIVNSKWVQLSLRKSNFSKNHFEIYGLDILMDENLNIAMTEANTQPGLDDTSVIMKNGEFNPEIVKANDITHGIINDTLALILDEKDHSYFSPFIPLHD